MFFETTIMGKTADLAMIQKMNIDTLHKEGKSQKVITERCGCLQSAVSKHIKCKVDWKEELGRKRYTSNRVPESGWRVERHRIHVAWSPCEVSTVSDDLGCHVICWCWPLCFLKSTDNAAIYQEIFRALHASFCWQALWRCWFHFPAGLGTCPHCQRYQSWFNDHGCTVLIGQQTRLTWTP